MSKSRLLSVIVLTALLTPALFADSLAIGFLSLDPTGPSANLVTFDLANETGPNDSTYPDTTFPVATPLTIVDFSLVVNFQGGGSITEQPAQFTSDGSGGFTGDFTLDLSAFPLASAQLSGTVDLDSVQLNDGLTVSIDRDFSALLLGGLESPLQPGDATVLTVNAAPEPASWAFLTIGSGLLTALYFGGRYARS